METTTPITKADLKQIIQKCENDATLTTREKLQIAEALKATLTQERDFDEILRESLLKALSSEHIEIIRNYFYDILRSKGIVSQRYSKETLNKIISKTIDILWMENLEDEDSKILQKKLLFLCYFIDLKSSYMDYANRLQTKKGLYCFKNKKILEGTRLGKLGNFNVESGNIVFNNWTFEENINKAKETFKSQID